MGDLIEGQDVTGNYIQVGNNTFELADGDYAEDPYLEITKAIIYRTIGTWFLIIVFSFTACVMMACYKRAKIRTMETDAHRAFIHRTIQARRRARCLVDGGDTTLGQAGARETLRDAPLSEYEMLTIRFALSMNHGAPRYTPEYNPPPYSETCAETQLEAAPVVVEESGREEPPPPYANGASGEEQQTATV